MLAEERPIHIIYPSIASLRLGRALGILYESVPIRIGRIRLSHLLFPLPTAPLAAALYMALKAGGKLHYVTTRRLYTARALKKLPVGEMPLGEIPLDDIGRIDILHTLGHRFFRAGDLVIRDHQGLERMRLEGVAQPEMVRQTIFDARNALMQTEAAQRVIAARAPSGVPVA